MTKQSTYKWLWETRKSKDKGIMFFSVSSVNDFQFLLDFGISDYLISYYYVRKSHGRFMDLITASCSQGALFMTDSGTHSFQGKDEYKDAPISFWEDYLKEYVAFLRENCHLINVAANLDIEAIVGNAQVDEWNKKYFKPLESIMQIVYVCHQSPEDKTGLIRFKEYCKLHDYVGVSYQAKDLYRTYYEIARKSHTRIHGFGWTSIPMLKNCPLFSVDSTTWLGGVRYGTTYKDDGKNFKVIDWKKKYVRKADKLKCKMWGVNYDDLLAEKVEAVNKYNLIGWVGARREYLRAANLKLTNVEAYKYDRREAIRKR